MSGLVSLAIFGGGILMFRLLYVGCRLPARPWWTRDGWLANLFLPVTIAMLAMGFAGVISALAAASGSALDWKDLVAGALILLLLGAVWWLLGRWAPAPVSATIHAGPGSGRDVAGPAPKEPTGSPRRAA